MTKRLGVIGHPISHSLSPLMHNTAFSILGLDCRYDAYDVDAETLGHALRDFTAQGFSGLNVTIPHKESILSFLNDILPEAQAIGAVNTVAFESGRLVGHNTDTYGVLKSLEPHRAQIAENTALLLGAGGAGRAVSYTLLTHFAPGELIILDCATIRAAELAMHCRALGTRTKVSTTDISERELRAALERSELIVNATPAGMSPAVDESPVPDDAPFHESQVVLDLIYTPLETKLLRIASSRGARTIGGLEMFMHQGARSFEIWTGQTMPIEKVRPVLEQRLKTDQT